MGSLAWRRETNGILSIQVDAFRLTVQVVEEASGTARFLLFRQETKGDPGKLISSRTELSLHAAINSAERLAVKLVENGNGSDTTKSNQTRFTKGLVR